MGTTMKNKSSSFFSSTVMSPYDTSPSEGQYWAHFSWGTNGRGERLRIPRVVKAGLLYEQTAPLNTVLLTLTHFFPRYQKLRGSFYYLTSL